MKHAESTHHSCDATFKILAGGREHTLRILSGSPLAALAELHSLVQNTHHFEPDAYEVTFLKRDGFSPYEFPKTRNPDVRRQKSGSGAKHVTDEMFPLAEISRPKMPGAVEEGLTSLPPVMGSFGKAHTPTDALTDDSPAASTASRL